MSEEILESAGNTTPLRDELRSEDTREAREIISLMESPTAADKDLVVRAYTFVATAHKGHQRMSGEPYLTHLVATAKDLARIGMTAKTIAAGLLHDCVEDVGVAPEAVEKEFGREVRFLVDGVTKLGKLKYRGTQRHMESLRKLLIATSQDARVLIIKLMDRLHNMRTLHHVRPEKRLRIALETLDIYAAIAHRLGMGVVRRELEDLAFEHAHPQEYASTRALLTAHEEEMRVSLEDMVRRLKREMAAEGITSFETECRVKGLYSLWQKLQRKGGDMQRIYDISAVRVIVRDIADCYRVLGIVHKLWQPLPNKIKDYIAFTKPNGYKSLHTTVFTGDGGIVEVQIRTRQMHNEAQYGIASHVSYKEGGGRRSDKEYEQGSEGRAGGGKQSSFDWIKSLIPGFGTASNADSADDAADAASHKQSASRAQHHYGPSGYPEWISQLGEHSQDPEFETVIKTDVFSHRVFVFTPNGDVVDLPIDATPIDFAYTIHSDIGDHISGAKVNGKMAPLNTTLRNGDIVEIETRKAARPSAKWLDIAKTSVARRHVRIALEKEKK